MAIDDPSEEVAEVDSVVEGLPSPDSQDVYFATLPYNPHVIASVAARLALQGGGGGGPPSGTAGGVLSGTFPNPAFAVDMATQAELNAAVAGIGPPLATVFNLDDPQYGIAGDATTDDSAAIQAVIDSLPATGALIQGAKRYKCVTSLDLSGVPSVRFLGLAGNSYVDTHGMQFRCGTVGMDLFTVDNQALLMEAGPVFDWVNFYDPVGGCTLFRLVKTNFWGFRNCHFGGFGQANPSTALDVSAGTGTGADSAWWFIDECRFRVFGLLAYTSGKGGLLLGAGTQGGTVKGGAFNGCYPAIEDFGGEGLRVFGIKIDNGGIRLSGHRAKLYGVSWEPIDNNAVGIRVLSGNANQIHGFSANDGGAVTGDVGIQIDSSASGTIVYGASFQNISTPWINNGVSSDLDFTASHAPTITGSRGGNAAVTSLLSQLAARGKIIDSTTLSTIGAPVQKNFDYSTGVTTTSTIKPGTGLTIDVGQTAIICAACDNSNLIASVSDGANTWTVDYTGGAGTHISFASCPVTTQLTNSSTITITWSTGSSHTQTVWLFGITGLAAAPFDKSAGASGTSTAPNSGATATLTQANEVCFAISRCTGDPLSFTPGTGWSSPLTSYNQASACEWKWVVTTDPVTATGTWGASGAWQCHVVTYKGATATP